MEKLLSEALAKAEQAEVTRSRGTSLEVSFENGRLKDISSEDSLSTRLRVIKDGRLGMSSTTKPGGEDEIVAYALETAQYGKEVRYTLPGSAAAPNPDIFDLRVAEVPTDKLIEIGRELVEAVREYDPKVLTDAVISRDVIEVELLNSQGFCGSYTQTVFKVSLFAKLVEGENFVYTGDSVTSTHLEYDLEAIKHKTIEDLKIARRNVSFEPGEYTVIFTPLGALSSFAHVLLSCLNGKAVVKKLSPWFDKLGKQLFDKRITLINDGTLDRVPGSARFDAEGVPTRRLPLIEQGVLRNFLLDLETAQQLQMEPTGTGTGNGPGVNNVILKPGTQSFAEMVKQIDKGVVIDLTMGAWGGNPYGGQVSGNIALGYKIEKGEIVGRIKDAMFSLNVFEVFSQQLIGLSSDTKGLAMMGEFAVFPYIAFADVNISAKK